MEWVTLCTMFKTPVTKPKIVSIFLCIIPHPLTSSGVRFRSSHSVHLFSSIISLNSLEIFSIKTIGMACSEIRCHRNYTLHRPSRLCNSWEFKGVSGLLVASFDRSPERRHWHGGFVTWIPTDRSDYRWTWGGNRMAFLETRTLIMHLFTTYIFPPHVHSHTFGR